MSAPTDSRADAPNPSPSLFRRRIERRQRGQRGSQWTTVPRWTELSAAELDALPDGTRRAVAVFPGVFCTLVKTSPDRWALLSRTGIPSPALAGRMTAPRVLTESAASASGEP